MINKKNIANYIQFLYQEKYNKVAPIEIINSWQKLNDLEIELNLKKLYQKWELNEVSIKLFENSFLSKKNTKAKFNLTIIILAIFLFGLGISFLLLKNNETPNEEIAIINQKNTNSTFNSPSKKEEPSTTIQNSEKIVTKENKKNIVETSELFQETIQKLINAENNRDFEKIYQCFSPNIVRYWDLKNPSHKQLKNRYEHLWKVSKNNFQKTTFVNQINSRTFVVNGNFSYFSIKENKEKQIETVTTFIFDSNGLILEVWGK